MIRLLGQSFQSGTEQVLEFARTETITGWWVWAAVIVAIAAGISLCIRFYRRDVAELPVAVRWTLIGLRLTAIVGLLFFFFDLVRRSQSRVTRVSEAIVMVDVSQSMSLPSSQDANAPRRSDLAIALVEDNELVQSLRSEHRTSVYAVSDTEQPELLATWPLQPESSEQSVTPEQAAVDNVAKQKFAPQSIAQAGGLSISIGLVLGIVSLILGAMAPRAGMTDSLARGVTPVIPPRVIWRSRLIAASAVCWVTGLLVLGGTYVTQTQQTLAQLLGRGTSTQSLTGQADAQLSADEQESTIEQEDNISDPVLQWQDALAATGSQSRLGDSLRSILLDHNLSTLAGIVLITDGQNNGGVALSTAVAAARRADVSVFPVGLGSSRSPTNARVVDLEAPRRVYPGDKFAISAVLQATGESAIDVDVELLDGLDDQAANEGEILTPTNNADPKRISTTLPGAEVIDRQTVRLTPEQGLTDVRFEMEPESVGRRRLAIRLVAPPEDRNRADDFQMARYEVVARKLRVLAIAGGPTREYRFVRNLLYRDDSVRLDVWLQTGQPGMSQDADALLSAFPPSAESLFQYDAIMMFDPNWSMIDMASLDLIDRFLTQQAGGLAIIAGPVYHPRISGARADPRSVQIAGFFPVNLATRGVLLGGGRQGGANPWALDLTEEAEQAEFLWVADSPEDSLKVWQAFEGVYDYVGVKNAKPGAKVYSYFSDPTTEIGGSLPIFMASQFYGAGRVFFQGSGEMWRLRGDGDEYFDAYYTKLVRWISEGRLLRDSKRGVLLVDSTRAMLGQTISIRAVLVDDQFQPLQKDSVAARVLAPGNKVSDVRLLPAADAPDGGTFVGNFIVTAAGSYEVQLTVGETIDEEILRQNIQVRLPTSELERPRRDDETLQSLASATRGKYFAIDSSDSLAKVSQTLTETITPQPQVTMLSGTPDAEFAMRRNASLMWLIASVLAFEWLVRRLHKLA